MNYSHIDGQSTWVVHSGACATCVRVSVFACVYVCACMRVRTRFHKHHAIRGLTFTANGTQNSSLSDEDDDSWPMSKRTQKKLLFIEHWPVELATSRVDSSPYSVNDGDLKT